MATAMVSSRVARRVRDALDQKRRTQEWLSNETGIPMRTLARRLHEANPSPMSVEELDTIASVLEVPLASLVIGDIDREQSLVMKEPAA